MDYRHQLGLISAGDRKTWPPISKEELEVVRDRKRTELRKRHEDEISEYEGRRVAETADPVLYLNYPMEGQQLQRRHQRETEQFEQDWEEVIADAVRLNDMYAVQATLHRNLEEALNGAKTEADGELTNLERQYAEQVTANAGVEEMHRKIADKLRAIGAAEAVSDDFSGFDRVMREVFFQQNCRARAIDPNKCPEIVKYPPEPTPPAPTKARSIQEKLWEKSDWIMIIAGLGLATAAGGGAGGVFRDSDGFHLNHVIFWPMFLLGLAAAYIAGKFVFPWLEGMRQLDFIDPYSYLEEKQKKELYGIDSKELADRKKTAKWAPYLGYLIVFGVFMTSEYLGWTRMASESNAAVMGDEGAFLINAKLAAFSVMFLTSLCAFGKLALVSRKTRDTAHELQDEIVKNSVEFRNRTDEYKRQLEEAKNSVATVQKYNTDLANANGNADIRLNTVPQVIELRQQIAAYLKARETVGAVERMRQLEEQMQGIVDGVEGKVSRELEALEQQEDRIDGVHKTIKAFVATPVAKESSMTPPLEETLAAVGAEELDNTLFLPIFPKDTTEGGGGVTI